MCADRVIVVNEILKTTQTIAKLSEASEIMGLNGSMEKKLNTRVHYGTVDAVKALQIETYIALNELTSYKYLVINENKRTRMEIKELNRTGKTRTGAIMFY